MQHILQTALLRYAVLAMLNSGTHCLVPCALAQFVPVLINYQGQLQDSTGSPLPTSDNSLSFRMWDSPVNGSKVWGPQVFDGQTGKQGHGGMVPVVRGYFNVILGPNDETDQSIVNAFEGTNRFVQIDVVGQGSITPRQQILSAPYALKAASADRAGKASDADRLAGLDWSVVFGVGKPSDGKIPGSKIAPNSITGLQLATNTINANQLVAGAVGADRLAPGAALENIARSAGSLLPANGNIPTQTEPNAPLLAARFESLGTGYVDLPETPTWRDEISQGVSAPTPTHRASHMGLGMGQQLLVWGGTGKDGISDSDIHLTLLISRYCL